MTESATMKPGYTELLPEGAGVPVRAQRFAKKAALAVAGAGLLLGLGATLRTRAAPAAPALRATAAKTGGLTTIGAADVAVCTDETADETSTCWEDFGGVCMYEKKSCNKYGGTKNTSGCGSGDSCFLLHAFASASAMNRRCCSTATVGVTLGSSARPPPTAGTCGSIPSTAKAPVRSQTC